MEMTTFMNSGRGDASGWGWKYGDGEAFGFGDGDASGQAWAWAAGSGKGRASGQEWYFGDLSYYESSHGFGFGKPSGRWAYADGTEYNGGIRMKKQIHNNLIKGIVK
jgi:hypothetical protein